MLGLFIALTMAVGAADDDSTATGKTVVYRGARILTANGAPIEHKLLIVRDGKIVDVGADGQVTVPDGAQTRNLEGKTIIPGIVDTHSHIGIYSRPAVPANLDGNETTGAVQSGLRAMDAIYPDDPGIRMAVTGGITTANIMPGSSNVIGGQTLYVKLRGHTVEEMAIPRMKVLGGLKMANGENPKNYARRQQPPGTRMKVAAMQREQFLKAREYRDKWNAYQKAKASGDKTKATAPPERDLGLEPLVEALERKRTVHFHSHRADDLMTAIRIAEEFGLELVLHHVTEGYRVADEIARHHVPVSLTLVDSPGGKLEAVGLLEENAGILAKAGVKVAINTDDFITDSRFILRTGSLAVRGGMSEGDALQALTLHGAEILHLDDRLGSLEKGKDADFVVLSGAPFSVYTQVLETYIDGKRVFDRSRHQDWLYQAGGFALSDPERTPHAPAIVAPRPAAKMPEAPANAGEKAAAADRLVILAGRLHTVAQGTIEDGAVLVEKGTIRYVGRRDGLQIPEGARVLTAREVTPGLIDAHTVAGASGILNYAGDQDQDELSDPNQADLRILDSFNPNEPLLEHVRRQGVTIIHACPGRSNVLAGQTGIFRTYGRSADQMKLRFPAGVLVNLGEVPKSAYTGKFPNSRMGTANLIRAAFAKAQGYAQKRQNKDDQKRPPLDLKSESLQLALEGKIPVMFSAHRADDIDTALRLINEFKLKGFLDLVTEGYLMADRIAEAKVGVVVHPTLQRISAMETFNCYLGNAAVLADRKVPVTLGTAFEGYVPKQRVLRSEAAVAMVNGLGFERTLRSITLDAARLLQISDRYGSLEKGKVADLVLYDGDPLEYATHVTHTIMDGRIVYDRADYLKTPFERRALPLIGGEVGCCMGVW